MRPNENTFLKGLAKGIGVPGVEYSIGEVYPGELKWPRRKDMGVYIPMSSGRSFVYNIELQTDAGGYSETKRSRMLDPHLLRRLHTAYGENFMNVMVVGVTDLSQQPQRFMEFSPYLVPNLDFHFWVVLADPALGVASAKKVAAKLKPQIHAIMSL